MQTDSLRYCSFETSLGTAARIMKDYNVGALPVLDKEKRVKGMITDRDICLALAMNRKNPAELSVKDVMSDVKLHSVSTKDDAEDALALMRLHQIGRLPVTDRDGKLKGFFH